VYIFGCRLRIANRGLSRYQPPIVAGEGLLIRHTNAAAVHTAFVRPQYRGRCIGAALLNAAIACAADAGFDRLFVEHESANILGARFWSRRFKPSVRFAMGLVELPRAD
jgi:GNAT superfamily N-acetyltransferase